MAPKPTEDLIVGQTVEAVRAFLKARGADEFTIQDVSTTFDLEKDKARRLLSALGQRGLVVHTGRATEEHRSRRVGFRVSDLGRLFGAGKMKFPPDPRTAPKTKRRTIAIGGHKLAGVPLRKIRHFLLDKARRTDAGDPESRDARFELFDLQIHTLGIGRREEDKLEPLVQALIARGWIEELPRINRQQRKRKFRLTAKGRQNALESAPLFNWPVGKPVVAGLYR